MKEILIAVLIAILAIVMVFDGVIYVGYRVLDNFTTGN